MNEVLLIIFTGMNYGSFETLKNFSQRIINEVSL